jgi:hypothetical protein
VQQHHVTAIPAGILKTDIPCKVFRNRKGIIFYGVVHEHPEIEYGNGVEYVCGVTQSVIMHYGYPDENTRRERFKRNLRLLGRDREKYPDRTLGKLLWLRDLAQMNKFELELAPMSDHILERCDEAVKVWEDLLNTNFRMAKEGISFYSDCVRLLGKGFECSMSLNADKVEIRELEQPVNVRFFSEEHAHIFFQKLLHDKVEYYESRYY